MTATKWIIIIVVTLLLLIITVVDMVRLKKKKRQAREILPDVLDDLPISGRDLRAKFALHGIKFSGVRFYAFMAELQNDGVVESEDSTEFIEGERLKIRHFWMAKISSV